MALARILETEAMDTRQEAADYDSMDHSQVNQRFSEDLLEFVGRSTTLLAEGAETEILDLGTGTARIPIEICRRHSGCRIVAADLSTYMLDLGRYNIEATGFAQRIMLVHVNAKQSPFAAHRFPIVISNSIVHHVPEPARVFAETSRLVAPHGAIFMRDLLRPGDRETLNRLVEQYAGEENERQKAMFADSLHAALTLDEVRDCVSAVGFAPETVLATSDRHWTWSAALAP